jgi:hypothetical protein
VCALYGVSRTTGDQWIERHLKHGPLGLEERSRQPHSSPRQTPKHVVDAFIALRRHHPAWGAKKRLSMLQKHHPSWPLPARSTVNTLARLSQLSAWWVRLGILPECIEPGKPPQNGRHERMPRTLTAETTRPPAAARRAQQRTFDRFRKEFNFERPHEALDMHTPASCDEVSPREMPTKHPPLAYPDRSEVRYASASGGIRWHHQWVNVSHTCAGAYVGLEEIDDGIWNVYFGPLKLGRRLERHRRIEEADGRLTRQR